MEEMVLPQELPIRPGGGMRAEPDRALNPAARGASLEV